MFMKSSFKTPEKLKRDENRLLELEHEDTLSDDDVEFDITIPLTSQLVPSKITDYFKKLKQPPNPNPILSYLYFPGMAFTVTET